jgi:lipid-binding SYLF domain-containing protein
MASGIKVTKIPVFGAGGGLGVVVDKRTESRSYVKVSRFEMGGGLGAQRFRVIVLFDDGKLVDRVASGAWRYEAGVEAAAGSATAGRSAGGTDKGYHAFRIADSGAAATVTVRVARSRPYLE